RRAARESRPTRWNGRWNGLANRRLTAGPTTRHTDLNPLPILVGLVFTRAGASRQYLVETPMSRRALLVCVLLSGWPTAAPGAGGGESWAGKPIMIPAQRPGGNQENLAVRPCPPANER